MRVEVEIGTIVVDALPSGVSSDQLRTAVAQALEARIQTEGVPGIATNPDNVAHGDARASARPDVLGAEIAQGIYGRLGR